MSTKDPMIGNKLLSSLRVVDLKEELEKRSLSKSGSKKDLADRLRNYVLSQEKTEEPPAVPAEADLDEDELPSIPLQEKQALAEKNPFLRDYFASQAELFHSQKVAKKLILEEEARRESEASAPSADEGGESAAEDLNSSTEEVKSGKVKDLAKKFENSATPKPAPQPQARRREKSLSQEPPAPARAPVVEEPKQLPARTTRKRQAELAAASKQQEVEAEKMIEKAVVEPPAEEEVKKGAEEESRESPPHSRSSRSKSRSRSKSPSRSPSPSVPEPESKSKENNKEREVSRESPEKNAVQNLNVNGNGTVKRLVEQFDSRAEETNLKTEKIVEKPSADERKTPVKEEEKKTVVTAEDKDKEEDSKPSSRSSSPEPEVADDEKRGIDEDDKMQVDEKEESISEKHADEPQPEKKRMVRNERVSSMKTEDEEEVLDYGEEEKLQTEPAKYSWSRRIIRVKSKYVAPVETVKWARDPDSKPVENINSDAINKWFGEVRLPSLQEREEKAEKSPDLQEKEDSDVQISRTFSTDAEESSAKADNITITRKVSVVPLVQPNEDDNEADKDLSPARNPPSEIILVSNLTRPFTLPQLRELLQRTGNLLDLWVDKIKSKCIAKYEKQEEAFETRAALHGINWPQSNPKALHVDYSTQDTLDEYKARDAGEKQPQTVDKPAGADSSRVREWDVGKRAKSRSPGRKSSRSPDRKRSRRSPSPAHRRHSSRSPHRDRRSRGDGKDPEPLGKALDELFRKTTATPSIYWLPLTSQQIAEKEEMRRKRMLERERRLSEMNKNRGR